MNDLRYAFRQLLKNPGFTAVAVLTLALGMGVNVSLFSIFNSAALRPLPGIKEANELAYCLEPQQIGYPQFEFYRDGNTSFAALTASAVGRFALDADTLPKRASASTEIFVRVVAGDYFRVLGADAPMGRYFLPEEYEAANGSLVIVLSHRFWQQHFEADPRVIGQTLRLNGEKFTIVGIAPASFPGREPSLTFMEPSRNGVDDLPDAWSPLRRRSELIALQRDSYGFRLIGRLKKGVPVRWAQTELEVLEDRLVQLSGRKKDNPANITSFRLVAGFSRVPPLDDKEYWRSIGSVTAVVSLVLLIACANIANLQMARGAERQKEIGIRLALGATRGRLVRQLLTESVLLAVMGGVAALLVGHWTANLVRGFTAQLFPEFQHYIESLDFNLDLRVVGYALALSVLCGLAFGLAPAFDFLKANLGPALKSNGGALGTRLSHSGLRNVLIIGQVAVSLALLIAAGLVTKTTLAAARREFSFANRNVLLIQMVFPYDTTKTRALHREVQERLAAFPGVEALGLTSVPRCGERRTTITIEGRQREVFPHLGPSSWVQNYSFTPGYFEALQISILQGRGLTQEDLDRDSPVLVISERMAQRYWPGQSAVGKRFSLGTNSTLWEVVGVGRDGMPDEALREVPGRSFYYCAIFAGDLYLPLRRDDPFLQAMSLVVRVSGNPKQMIPQVMQEIRNLDRNVEVSAQVLRELIDTSLAPVLAGALATAGLGLLALVLATMGIYGVMAYVVSRRTHEIGVRMALGARNADVLKMSVAQGMRVVLIGVIIGLAAALGLGRILATQMVSLNPLDPVAFIGLTLVSLLAALLACYLPARRAAKVDPMVALRCE